MKNGEKIDDAKLVVTIDNNNPVELIDLTKSLFALSNQYSSFISKNAGFKEQAESKLYIREVRSGSVIIEMASLAVATIPFIENTNAIVDFGKHIKGSFEFLLYRSAPDPGLTVKDMKDLSDIVNVTAKDPGSMLNTGVIINGDVHINSLNITSVESNAVQNSAKQFIESLKSPVQDGQIHKRVVMTWFQARGGSSKKGNKAIIKEIQDKELNVIFDDSILQEKMLHGDANPFNMAFVVDVKVISVNDRVSVYKVIGMHDSFEIE